VSAAQDDHAALMDRIYRFQRPIYDLTRKYYLLGRDRLLARLEVPQGARVLEAGCGTARNLIRLHRMRPDLELYGFDLSAAMLRTAEQKIARKGLSGRIRLAQASATDFTAAGAFGLDGKFDAIFYSYTLSMVPQWDKALDNALDNLAPGGVLGVVDFWDQADLPGWFRAILTRWLSAFHVHPDARVPPAIEDAGTKRGAQVSTEPVAKRYACISLVEMPRSEPAG
jgi:S-adenosylmethionine-diacylgycerolhomoserine-N-methlytransferase